MGKKYIAFSLYKFFHRWGVYYPTKNDYYVFKLGLKYALFLKIQRFYAIGLRETTVNAKKRRKNHDG